MDESQWCEEGSSQLMYCLVKSNLLLVTSERTCYVYVCDITVCLLPSVLCVHPGVLPRGGCGDNTTASVQGFWPECQKAGHELQQTEVSYPNKGVEIVC